MSHVTSSTDNCPPPPPSNIDHQQNIWIIQYISRYGYVYNILQPNSNWADDASMFNHEDEMSMDV